MSSMTCSHKRARNGSWGPIDTPCCTARRMIRRSLVVAALVAGQHAVHDEKGDAAGVLGHGAQGTGHRVARAVGLPRELLAQGDQRAKGVGLVDRGDALMDGGHALEPHAGVDALRGQGNEAAVLVHLVLHEDEVPVLHPAVALAAGAAVGPAAAVLLTHIVVELGAGPARAGGAGQYQKLSPRPRCTMSASVKPCDFQMSMASASSRHALVVASEDAHLDARARDAELVAENSSAQAMASVLK